MKKNRSAAFLVMIFVISGFLSSLTLANAASEKTVPVSNFVQAGDFLYVSGQIGFDPATGNLVEGGASLEVKQIFVQIDQILKSNGLTFKDVVKVNIFCTNLKNYVPVNDIYATYFPENPPARSFVQVAALPVGASIEVELIAYKKK